MFLRKVVVTRSIPFALEEEPVFSEKEKEEILGAVEESRGEEGVRTVIQGKAQEFLDSIITGVSIDANDYWENTAYPDVEIHLTN